MGKNSDPGSGSVGGDWVALGVAKSGLDKDDLGDYLEAYYDNVRARVKSSEGVLSTDTYTEYSRTAIAVKGIGKDPTDIEGYDVLQPLKHFNAVSIQEFNGPAYALIAFNCSEYAVENENQYVTALLDVADNKPFYEGDNAEADYIAMLLQALSYYRDDESVESTIEKSLDRLEKLQKEDGSFGSCESTAQVIIALTMLKENPLDFAKNGKSVCEGLLNFVSDKGFSHKKGEDLNQMATEQGLLALDAVYAFQNGEVLF